MGGNVVVKGGIDCARAKTVGNSEKTYLIKFGYCGEAEKGNCRQKNACRGYGTCAKSCGQPLGKQAGEHRAERYYHRNNSHIRNRHVKGNVERRP